MTTTTKQTINKAWLATLPEAMADQIRQWKADYRKSQVRIRQSNTLSFDEDARITVYGIDGSVASGRVAGEWSGHTGLSPVGSMPLYLGMAAVEDMIFCGVPMLTITTGTAVRPVAAIGNGVLQITQEAA